MQKSFLIAIFAALISGIAIGTQSSLTSSAGKVTGPILAGLLINFAGGVSAGLILFVIYIRKGNVPFSAIQAPMWGIIIVSGLLGIGIIAGVAYSLPKIGIAAGLSTIIAGQMTVAVLVDTFGLTGGEPIPLNWSRISGLVLLALGTWAILAKGNPT
jgi:transporter family-2 protein